jgi:hypothetical protein
MSGGLIHHTDEENGPSHTVGHELSKQQGCYSLERNQCVCADVIRVPANEKNKPTPLAMTDVVRDVEKGTTAVISVSFTAYVGRTFNNLRTNFADEIPRKRVFQHPCLFATSEKPGDDLQLKRPDGTILETVSMVLNGLYTVSAGCASRSGRFSPKQTFLSAPKSGR